MEGKMTILELKNVTKRYKNVTALDEVCLSIEQGKTIGLLGPNGSGKTTLIKIITGMLKRYRGVLYYEGKRWSYHAKEYISYLPDVFVFDRELNIKQLVRYYEDMFEDFNTQKFYALLSKFKIENRSRFDKLSKGNKEKLQLAFVLARDALIYIFDEPIGGVDPAVREIILETIMTYKQTNATVILATHQIHDIENLFDEVVFLKQGKIVLHENTKTLIAKQGKSLVDCFKEVFRHDD